MLWQLLFVFTVMISFVYKICLQYKINTQKKGVNK